jgi:hypothetical protein
MPETQQQNIASKTMAATLFRQQSKMSDNGGYNPSDMSAILKQNSNIFSNGGMSLNNGNTNSEQTNFMNKYVLSGESYHGNGTLSDILLCCLNSVAAIVLEATFCCCVFL